VTGGIMADVSSRVFRLLIGVAQTLPASWRMALAQSPKAGWLRRLSQIPHRDGDAVVNLSAPLAGYRMRLNMRAGHRRFALGTYEPDVCALIQSRPHGETMLDIGANVGYFTLLMVKQAGRDGRVIAFEPVPAVHALLCENLRLNNCTQASAERMALADLETFETMRSERDSPVPFTARLADDGDCRVAVGTLDRYVEASGLKALDFVKIDVEGAEDRVVRGMSGTLRTFKPDILLEIHKDDGTPSEALEQLQAMGYELRRLGHEGQMPCGTRAEGGHVAASWRAPTVR
jgi:FkbM family methyltransferase